MFDLVGNAFDGMVLDPSHSKASCTSMGTFYGRKLYLEESKFDLVGDLGMLSAIVIDDAYVIPFALREWLLEA